MSFAPFIKIQHLRYSIPNQKTLFSDISLNFGFEKTGLVGKNGFGKSTLIRLIVGELIADAGTIETQGTLAYFSQNHAIASEQTVADLLNLADKLDAKKVLAKTQAEIQQRQERRAQKNSYGRQLCKTGKVDKLTANSWRDRSEKTQSRHSKINKTLLKTAEEDLQTARAKIEINYAIDVELPQTFVPNGKVVVDIEDLNFAFPPSAAKATDYLFKNFNLKLIGPERIALIGDNGTGKTTLLKLILGKLKPSAGKIYIGA